MSDDAAVVRVIADGTIERRYPDGRIVTEMVIHPVTQRNETAPGHLTVEDNPQTPW